MTSSSAPGVSAGDQDVEVIDKFTSLLDKRTVTETFTALENFRNLLFNTLEIAMLVFHGGRDRDPEKT